MFYQILAQVNTSLLNIKGSKTFSLLKQETDKFIQNGKKTEENTSQILPKASKKTVL